MRHVSQSGSDTAAGCCTGREGVLSVARRNATADTAAAAAAGAFSRRRASSFNTPWYIVYGPFSKRDPTIGKTRSSHPTPGAGESARPRLSIRTQTIDDPRMILDARDMATE